MSAVDPVRITGEITLSDGTSDTFSIDARSWQVWRTVGYPIPAELSSIRTVEMLAGVLHNRFALTIATEPEDEEEVTRCRWCGEEIGIIHYSDGDRWQITPQLGDDLCEIRAELATEDGIYRHEPEGTK